MSSITVQNIIDEVRALVNRIEPLKGDGSSFAVSTPDNVEDTPARTLHDEYLIQQVDHIQRLLAQSCKAFHVNALITEHLGGVARYNSLNDRLRILHGRIERLGADCSTSSCKYIVARYRGIAEHEFLQQAGRSASDCYPAYTYDDDILEVYPKHVTDNDGITVTIDYIVHPTKLTATSDTLQLDSRFYGAIVAYVASRAFNVLGKNGMSEAWHQIYQRRVGPMLRSTYIGKASGFVGPIPAENESEVE